MTLDAERVSLLKQVFWDMTDITTRVETSTSLDENGEESESKTLHITVAPSSADDVRLAYRFDAYQNGALDFLLENLDEFDLPMGELEISQEDAIALLENLPDGLSPERRRVVMTALSLVGKVSYFWGGKSTAIGWDDRWGLPMEVTAEGNAATGTIRPFGLDCSGFVDWVFWNASDGTYLPGQGGGTVSQHNNCTDIPWSEAQPGDLVFYADDCHVGIVGGYDENGNLLIIHCGGASNGVHISGSAGFTQAAKTD